MKLFRTTAGSAVEAEGVHFLLPELDWDQSLASGALLARFADLVAEGRAAVLKEAPGESSLLPPIRSQEVWAAGVTYFRSREARMEEAADAGGGDFYERVYSAKRPELFFKATPHRVVGHGQPIRIRSDSKWNVPEPELALAVSAAGEIVGYTIGNDVSSRDLEGENPLYLPQAKTYDQCCALGPGLLVTADELPGSTPIELQIRREGRSVFEGSTSLSQMKRSPRELVDYLFRDNSFPHGCFLLTGTGVVPPDSFTLQRGDEVRVSIEPIGTLVNRVEQAPA